MCKRFLFLGISDTGMAPLACYVHQWGNIVYGFDDALSPELEQFFETQKIIICEQFPYHIDYVIFSSAIAKYHPWIQVAQTRKIVTIRRGHFLAKFCRQKKVIAIAGSHGKTTTTGMLIDHLPHCDYILGGFFLNKDKLPAFYFKESHYLICEVDESDRTIESFHPHLTVVINLEDDHLQAYGHPQNLDAAFKKLFSHTQSAVIISKNNERLRHIAQNLSIPIFFADTTSSMENIHTDQHYAENIAVVQQTLSILAMEKDPPVILPKIPYTPIFRRNQFLGLIHAADHAIEAWTDYAHHPTEIESFIKKFQSIRFDKKILFAFQPHRYSQINRYAHDFAKIFEDKEALILPAYPENEISSGNGITELIFQYLPKTSKVTHIDSLKNFDLQKFLENHTFDIILFIGAGDIHQQAQDWLFAQRIFYFKRFLKNNAPTFQENFSLRHHNTLQIDATAPLWIEPQSEQILKILLQQLKIFEIPYCIIGHGSNLLLNNFKGVFISLKEMPTIFEVNFPTITASSNMALAKFSKRIVTLGLQDCEELVGIPGSLGGALHMNAGAHQQFIFDHLISIKFLDSFGETKVIAKEQIDFGYRCGFHGGAILSAQFSFPKAESSRLLFEKIKSKIKWRRERQPLEPNAGSIFKNPENRFAGWLIEQTDLKGTLIGGAKVSEKHANFIVNHNRKATANDIKRLMRLVRQKVFEKYGIFLEREILFAFDKNNV